MYFCIVKQFENIFRTIFLAIYAICATSQLSQAQTHEQMDSIEIGLITCSPHEEVYSLYGHTAIRCHNLATGEDSIYNYGIFDFKKPYFIWRFVFGLTDYELGRSPAGPFFHYYHEWGSQVTEDVLNINAKEKENLLNALRNNYLPQNRSYRYNYFYDNCATRPRDIIESNIEGSVVYEQRTGESTSFRDMIRKKTAGHPWATFGNDILLGVKADLTTTQREQEFLPDILQSDIVRAAIQRDGITTPLIKEHRIIVPSGQQTPIDDFPVTPQQCGVIILVISLCIFVIEHFTRHTFWWFDFAIMAFTGLAGILLFLMIFSQHPTTSINLQILVLNPLALVFIPSVIRKKKTRWFAISAICICLFFIGGIIQDYAEGINLLALCLLLRFLRHINDK